MATCGICWTKAKGKAGRALHGQTGGPETVLVGPHRFSGAHPFLGYLQGVEMKVLPIEELNLRSPERGPR